jgi:hypothetical protein
MSVAAGSTVARLSMAKKLALGALGVLLSLIVGVAVIMYLFVMYGGYCKADILENSYEAIGIAKRFIVDRDGAFRSAEVRNLRFVEATGGAAIQEIPAMWTFDIEVKRVSPNPAEADIRSQVYQMAVTKCGEVLLKKN